MQEDAQFIEGILWAGALVGLNLLRHTIDMVASTTADRFQEGLRGHIEEQCYRQAQTMSLWIQLETVAYYDQLHRARRGLERRLFSTMAFLWRSVSDIVAFVSLLGLSGEFPLGTTAYSGYWNDSGRLSARTRQQNALPPAAKANIRRAALCYLS